jgi:hypothetical protein
MLGHLLKIIYFRNFLDKSSSGALRTPFQSIQNRTPVRSFARPRTSILIGEPTTEENVDAQNPKLRAIGGNRFYSKKPIKSVA